ncbi:acetyl-CoA synthetase-like protein [Trametopsis cervina]|nr:acetyl-CoA synthetase-like protein [Trametopsis cervina]
MSASDPTCVEEWETITYAQFDADVQLQAAHWTHTLKLDGIPPRSVVALWLGGMSYRDVVTIYGMIRADYIPELFSLKLPNPGIVFELMRKANAKALIYDHSLQADVSTCSVPVHSAATEPLVAGDLTHLPDTVEREEEDTVAIFHTSGSTSGSPKLIHCSYRWFECIITKANIVSAPRTAGKQDVTGWMGSMCHIAQNFMLLGSMQHGSCTIIPTQIMFSSSELVDHIVRCGLNRLYQFPTFMLTHFKTAQKDPKVLHLLQGLDQVLYSGLALPHEDEQWAHQQGIAITNLFGNTECGAMMLSVGGSGPLAHALQPIEGTRYGFFPISSATAESGPVDANSQLLELVILSESGDCPDPALRAADGHYHTGDLFIEVAPGKYVSRGRDDDWIKSQNSLRCDTKAIENHVRSTCDDLISECIVVGNGRPNPALFVEPKGDMREDTLKRTIIRRTRPFYANRYLHEQIVHPKFVFVVPRGTLPRTATKGNVRRKAVEEAFKAQLDDVFGTSF